jgi:hypothetical protein
MKLILKISLACLLATGCASKISAQTYVKLNGLYALVGVVNPAVEFTLSPKSTFQTEIVVSPWKSINNHHALFCIFMGEYRRYFKEHNRGWYLGANIGMQAFDLSKPYIENWKLKFENRYSKGYGFMIGLCVGYEHIFRERWVLDGLLEVAGEMAAVIRAAALRTVTVGQTSVYTKGCIHSSYWLTGFCRIDSQCFSINFFGSSMF